MSNTNISDLSTLTAEELIELVTKQTEQLAALQAKKERKPRELTDEQRAKQAAREAFEAITPSDDPVVSFFQSHDRFAQLDATAKFVRALPYQRVAELAATLAAEVSGVTGADVMDVAAAGVVRKPKPRKAKTEGTDAELVNADA